MARIVYALSGQGRGHASRVMAMSDLLRLAGHEVMYCCGGTAYEILASRYNHVLEIPALRQIVRRNRLRIGLTLQENAEHVYHLRSTVAALADNLATYRPDVVITDFEAFTPMAARKLDIPVISFNHQEIVTRTEYSLPMQFRLHATLTGIAIRLIVPKDPVQAIITSFYFPKVKRPSCTTLVRPIIRPAVLDLEPRDEGYVLVYLNQSAGSDFVLEAMRKTDANFIVYNFDNPPAEVYPNMTFKSTNVDGFLADLSACTAVISTAGFTLISEALYLGKPTMVMPNEGIFEQTLNAIFLQREGLGHAIFDGQLDEGRIRRFLDNRDVLADRLRGWRGSGNSDAVRCIEGVLRSHCPSVFPVRDASPRACRETDVPGIPETAGKWLS